MHLMNHKRNLFVLACVLAIGLPIGCALIPSQDQGGGQPTTQPYSDPIVVSAEKGAEAAFIAVDAFLQLDESLGRVGPQHSAAETLRKEFPIAFRAARQATRDYAAGRIDYSTLEGRLNAVESAARIARASFTANKPR